MMIDFTPRELEVIRMSLRQEQEAHRRNGFLNLAQEIMVLRSKISDAILDKNLAGA
jgi:hypothetical protein